MREAYDANQKARRWPRHGVTVSEDATKTAEAAAPNCAREPAENQLENARV